MPSDFNPDESYFRIQLVGSGEGFPSLLDISSFLYDFNLIYEIARLATDPNYNDFKFSDFVYYRARRPLKVNDRLYVQTLREESPLLLVAVVAVALTAIPALWGLVQIVEKITNAPLNRRKLRAEVEKLERENLNAQRTSLGVDYQNPEELRIHLRIREAETYYNTVERRLERSSVRIRELDIDVVQAGKLRKPE